MVLGRFGGFPQTEIARRTVPCFKYVVEPDGDKLSLCLLVDSRYLYGYPDEALKGSRSLLVKAAYLRGEMERLRLREFQPGYCRYVGERQTASAAG
jgi:hypothetical protein